MIGGTVSTQTTKSAWHIVQNSRIL